MSKKDIEVIRKWLKGYRISIKEINARTEHIKWLKEEIFTPLSESGKGRDKYASEKVDKIMSDILRDAEIRLVNLQYEIETIENEINKLDDYERCILYNRYILGIPWLEMPERIGYEIAQCQRIERKAIQHLALSPHVQKLLNKDTAAQVHKPVNNLTFSQCTAII